ncbi:MAG TPA: PHP domain-containing protein [Firmicutes bacterium]|nr:PHP domain-containing protein [Bacillota bacterium]
MSNRERGGIDLHLHSDFSDGYYPPKEVISKAARAGLKAAALTDHDTMDGIPEALKTGRRLGIEVVPGVEVSAVFRGEEIHLLGYYPTLKGRLPLFLKLMKKERWRRAGKILCKLNQLGIYLNRDDVLKEAGQAAPGRLHFARLLLKHKIVTSIEEAFKLYLGKGSTAYFPRKILPVETVLRILHESQAVTVLAHPGLIKQTPVDELLSLGLRGVEVYYPDHDHSEQRSVLQLARERKLIITGGSDFHGDPHSKVNGPGYIAINYHYLLKLRQAAQFK